MLNHYQILGVSRNATHSEIKAAFKKLALSYHPDRNPGDEMAEEKFKLINEAYQVLSDPDKRKRYDFILNYSFQDTSTTSQAGSSQTYTRSRTTYHKPHKDRSVYDRYGKFSWRNAPKYKQAPTYKVDRNYFKVQLLTLLAMVILSGIIFATNRYWEHLDEQERLALEKEKAIALAKAQAFYEKGDYRKAIEEVSALKEQYPFDHQFYEAKEQMVLQLNQQAKFNFENNIFEETVKHLEVVKDFERPMKMATWEMLSDAYYKLGEFEKSADALDRILERDKQNLRLAVRIAKIYKDNLNNTQRALEYYDEAKMIFKEFQNDSYGPAFELVVEGQLLPDFYYDLFVDRARLNMESGNYAEALTDCNWAIFMRPKIAITYNMRAHCKREEGLLARACLDWQRALERGHTASKEDLNRFCK